MLLCWHHETCWFLVFNLPSLLMPATEDIYLRAEGSSQNSSVMMSQHDLRAWNDTSHVRWCTVDSGNYYVTVWPHIPGWLWLLLSSVHIIISFSTTSWCFVRRLQHYLLAKAWTCFIWQEPLSMWASHTKCLTTRSLAALWLTHGTLNAPHNTKSFRLTCLMTIGS